ncbi:hypothetical protein CCHL11_09044 [Colletotrichum chlorophyti]|uniref:Uncharacterized protein n=1 Tax=Colletotrichum chlorophyti TaxID=708187 RepID=A0A1Q8RB99_9PEZI|nr:hypothetical protein CCHL11_09044 [Colletotrichum chlorophyti]
MSFRSDSVEIGSDNAGPFDGRVDMSSHNHSLALHHNGHSSASWLHEVFLQTCNRSERIAVGSPRTEIGFLGLGFLEHHMDVLPTLRQADAVPVTDRSAVSPKHLRWRRKVATWPLSQQEARNNQSFAV